MINQVLYELHIQPFAFIRSLIIRCISFSETRTSGW